MKQINCYRCQIEFWVPDSWWATRQQDEHTFTCPNGHEQHFCLGDTEAQKLAKRLEAQQVETTRQRERAERLERSLSATQAVVTRQKNRANNGVCLCCKRSFANVQKHMATKHPDFCKRETA